MFLMGEVPLYGVCGASQPGAGWLARRRSPSLAVCTGAAQGVCGGAGWILLETPPHRVVIKYKEKWFNAI